MKRIIVIVVIVVLVVFCFNNRKIVQEVSLNKRFNDEFYSFDKLNPGDKKSINYFVTNDSTSTVKVRVKINEIWLNDRGKIINAPDDAIIMNINNDDWIYIDGYYYYKYSLMSGTSTSPLVYDIELNDNLSNVNCTKSNDGMISTCIGNMNGLSDKIYKINFKSNIVDERFADKIWK